MKYFSIILFILLTGCVTSQRLPLPSHGAVTHDSVRVVLDRESKFHGGGVSFTIKDSGVVVGELGNYDGRLIWDRPAGDFCLSAGTINKSVVWQECFRAMGGSEARITFSTHDGFTSANFNAQRIR